VPACRTRLGLHGVADSWNVGSSTLTGQAQALTCGRVADVGAWHGAVVQQQAPVPQKTGGGYVAPLLAGGTGLLAGAAPALRGGGAAEQQVALME
jgi:hypothetical protein